MVGHENEFEMMQDQHAREARELEVVSIVWMGGIGKTTLVNKIYNDQFIMSRFEIRAKVTVSLEYCVLTFNTNTNPNVVVIAASAKITFLPKLTSYRVSVVDS